MSDNYQCKRRTLYFRNDEFYQTCREESKKLGISMATLFEKWHTELVKLRKKLNKKGKKK